MPPVKIIIAEDYAMYCQGLKETLADISGVTVTGTAANGQELLALVEKDPPQVVITDIRMPVMDGIEATRWLHQHYPQIGIIALTMHDDEHFLVKMLAAGARGYVFKECTGTEFAHAIADVSAGRHYYCPFTQQRIAELMGDDRLLRVFGHEAADLFSEKELRLIGLACEGYQDKEIAWRLELTPGTVKKYRQQLVEKTGSRGWAGVIRYVLKHQLINRSRDGKTQNPPNPS